jgi:hypothetical protein
LRICQDSRRRATFHDEAVLHHRDIVADLRGDAQIAGDEQQRDAELALNFVEQLEHLCLEYRQVGVGLMA